MKNPTSLDFLSEKSIIKKVSLGETIKIKISPKDFFQKCLDLFRGNVKMKFLRVS